MSLSRSPQFWLGGFLLWFVLLCVASSFKLPGEFSPPINHFDKVEHFCYFFGGSGLFCAWLYRRDPANPDWKKLIATAVFVIALIGALDESHQTFTPGRSGNDPLDWLADLLGGLTGAFVFKRFHHLLK